MKFHQLQLTAKKTAKRIGRGIAAGQGKTAGRGTKGQKARKSGGVRPGFEGGQNPLMQRLPKLGGFRSARPKVENVYTGQLEAIKGLTVDNRTLAEAGIISSAHVPVKLLVNGELTKKYTVKLQGASKPAAAMVKKAGGSFTAVERIPRPKLTKENK